MISRQCLDFYYSCFSSCLDENGNVFNALFVVNTQSGLTLSMRELGQLIQLDIGIYIIGFWRIPVGKLRYADDHHVVNDVCSRS